MGKVNLVSLKSHIENASVSFQKLQPEESDEIRVINIRKVDSIEALQENTHEMLKNIPSFVQTG